jgi:hypothetical protein
VLVDVHRKIRSFLGANGWQALFAFVFLFLAAQFIPDANSRHAHPATGLICLAFTAAALLFSVHGSLRSRGVGRFGSLFLAALTALALVNFVSRTG